MSMLRIKPLLTQRAHCWPTVQKTSFHYYCVTNHWYFKDETFNRYVSSIWS